MIQYLWQIVLPNYRTVYSISLLIAKTGNYRLILKKQKFLFLDHVKLPNIQFKIDDNIIVEKYKYLGIIFSQSGSFLSRI